MKDLFEELCKGCNAKALYDEEYCDACTLMDDIAEHDAKVRAEAIDEFNNKVNYLKEHYTDACNMCTKMECDVCAIDNIIEHLEQLKEQKNEQSV